MPYLIYECLNPLCRFRFPGDELEGRGEICPHCHDRTMVVARPGTADFTRVSADRSQLPHVEVLLDNTRSVYNVGSIFRTSDGVGVKHLHLCGITATPEHPKLAKTALGADSHLTWTHALNGVDAARALKENGYQLWALEDGPGATNLFELDHGQLALKPNILVLGNEVVGVDPGILDLCDHIIMIPMVGEKRSLNVTIAFGTAVYYMLFGK